jgi:hypothetical protein
MKEKNVGVWGTMNGCAEEEDRVEVCTVLDALLGLDL